MDNEQLFLIKQQLQEKVAELRLKHYDNSEILRVLNEMEIEICSVNLLFPLDKERI